MLPGPRAWGGVGRGRLPCHAGGRGGASGAAPTAAVADASSPAWNPRMTARSVMILGCTSGAGKSWLATALCRWYADRGLKVAPFKAQNMSNHARVVDLAGGPPGSLGEIGSAQYFQALAARARPEVRMNPVLLKPEADTRSQVVLMGRVRD